MILNCQPMPPGWPWWPDHELERLRRMEQVALREQEKQRIRERLRQMGIDPDAPFRAGPPVWSSRSIAQDPPNLAQIIDLARRSKRAGG